ncbi:hypothetical protein RIF25_02860 [Thermosynechococcaceae cyanobacterium BACA0444]|uniref:Uncharacterized protein n=1 Tax=Pseudocalidococcus azoricus BACA0444 TaxID=2918990 RepID=A0AAE4FR60_9CYAN|nr:hypothetical protein [Pseudocalidococcus azoricus]MDS3859742.1 hypothetical protein [Pseudocalidococcus azoricus BACA0444]
MNIVQWWDELLQGLETELQVGLAHGIELLNSTIEQTLLPLIKIPEPAAPWQRLYVYQAGVESLPSGTWPLNDHAWQITAHWPQTIPLLELPEHYLWLEIPSMRQGDQLLLCRAWAKADPHSLPPKLSLGRHQAWGWTQGVTLPADGEWHLLEVCVHLAAPETEPGLIKLALEFIAPGQAWLRDFEVLQAPAKLRPLSELFPKHKTNSET